MVAACPPRDCWNREGVAWLEERLYEGREAELQDRVDRRRLRVEYAGEAESRSLAKSLDLFRAQSRSLEGVLREGTIEIGMLCDPPAVSVVQEVDP